MKKKISFLLSTLIVMSTVLISNVSPALAAGEGSKYFESISWQVLPNDIVSSEGYVNSKATGFRINTITKEGFKPESMELYLDSDLIAVDTETYDNATNYVFSSNTNSVAELMALLPAGSHEWKIVARDTTGPGGYTVATGNFVADYTAPTGLFSAESSAGKKTLAIGDVVNIIFTPGAMSVDTNIVEASVSGRKLFFKELGGNFVAPYIVTEGDLDQNLVFSLSEASATDRAGNTTIYGDVTITTDLMIDANSPKINLISPTNTAYDSSDVLVRYDVSGAVRLAATLDGQEVVITNCENLKGLSEGGHQLKLLASDTAGNTAIAVSNFTVDTMPPVLVVQNSPTELMQGDNLVISGRGEPGLKIVLRNDGRVLAETVVDDNGGFSFLIATSDMTVSNYNITLESSDAVGNSTIVNLSFKLTAKPALSLTKRPVKVASAGDLGGGTKSDGDDNSAVASSLVQPGRIIASDDFRPNNIAWQTWIILAGLIALSCAVATTSYYGYVWLSYRKQGSTTTASSNVVNRPNDISMQTNLDDSQPDKKDEPPKNYTRW